MLQSHGDVEPVEVRRCFDAGIDQDRAQPGTAVGERRQLGVGGLANIGKATPDQRLDRGVGFGDRSETWRAPSDVSTLPRRTSRCRWPSSQLRTKVESRVRVIAAAAVAGSAGA